MVLLDGSVIFFARFREPKAAIATAAEDSSTITPKVKASGITGLPKTVKSLVALFPCSSIAVTGLVPLYCIGTVIFAVKAPRPSVVMPAAGVTLNS